ncbi:type 1 fimbrial protein [Cronobacter turicensis]|uniref:fimbrial protein n=1 Tax=Cronobacter turicensis TaxID=413502 RepID=UPI001FCFD776|nr:fimbrial protein [Cronobacter turicensis]EKY3120755.1 type 1 fimbrial protein [Cronobacter turicensis]ELU8452875.1 type 1 fimbrial protein [Cronobacter turicensis]ELY4109458.1 type 1 fimbrial protein [Cronobacter turicensis]ELY4215754.1 type 1 fimbrial protein [Cronobacter turicensis]EMA1789795.1 type 1 fimbrial protein [Cronobacter turicensis]
MIFLEKIMIKFILALYALCRKRKCQQLSCVLDKAVSYIMVLFVLLLVPGMALASDCNQQTSSLSKDLGDITVSADLAVGQYITGELNFSDDVYYAMCESTNTVEKEFSGGLTGTLSVAGVYDGRTTFNTNIPGVGIQFGGGFSVTSNQQHNTNYALWLSNGATSATAFSISDIGWGEQFYIHYSPSFRLVKTAPTITSGSLGSQVGQATASGNQGSASLTVSISGTVTVKDSTPYCDNNVYGGPYNHNVNFGTVMASGDIAIGDVIATQTIMPSNTQIGGCHAGQIPYSGIFTGAYSTRNSGYIYATNVPGVGIRAQVIEGTPTGLYFGDTVTVNESSDYGLYDNETVKFDLIKTGEISAGQFSTGLMSKMTASSVDFVTYTITGGSITVPGCSVLTPATSVTLGNHLTTEFTGINSTTASVDVPVQLQCPAGVWVLATLNATPDTSTTQSGAIKLTPSSGLTAGGIAVQMLNKQNSGVPIGEVTQLQTTASGIFDFGWKARYLQTTSAPVSVGDANVSATVTIDYE